MLRIDFLENQSVGSPLRLPSLSFHAHRMRGAMLGPGRLLVFSFSLIAAITLAAAAAAAEGEPDEQPAWMTVATPEAELSSRQEPELLRNRVVPVFMGIVGLGIAGIWAVDISKGRFADQGRFFSWREGENLLWPHLFAEYLTAAGLLTGAAGLYLNTSWGSPVSLLSLGALTYTAVNSSGWVLAERDRLAYGVPMWMSLAGAVVCIVILIP